MKDTDCPHRVEVLQERRRANALNVEIGTPLPRCLLKVPEHWPSDAPGALRWLGSGGSALVFGPCSARCPKKPG